MGEIEVVPVRWIEVAAPSSASAGFPEKPHVGPDRRIGGGGGSVSHSQVSRQSGNLEVEALCRSGHAWIELRRQRGAPSPRYDPETRPTKPFRCKMFGRRRVNVVESASQAIVKAPSSRHSLRIVTDRLRAHRRDAFPGEARDT